MAMSDPLGDMLTRIRNGQHARKEIVNCPWARLREAVCKVLSEEGYIAGYEVVEYPGNKKDLVITLRYNEDGGVIRELHRVSKPGRRIYSGAKDMPRYYNGLGVHVISTPKGVMTDHTARAENVGGEVLCQVF